MKRFVFQRTKPWAFAQGKIIRRFFMRKTAFFTLALVLVMAFTLILAGCPDSAASGNQNTPPTVTNPPKTPESALRAVPTASGTASSPKVLDSYTDGTKNYYLVDVGYVRNMFVSTILQAAYNGMTPITVSKTTITTTTITNGLTETIAESIKVSNTQNVKVGVEAAWKQTFPAGQFSAKLNVEWTGSWTNSKTSTKSTETSVSRTKSFEEMDTTSVTIGDHGEPAGNYRYALYAVCDVYFIISTSLDNQNLLSWDTVVCARDSSYTPHWDYSADGVFDNSPDGNEITFTEDFYKNLPKPVGTEPINPSPVNLGINPYPKSYGSVTPESGSYPVNKPINITATPNTGYNFIGWVVTDGTATFGNSTIASTTVTLSSNATIQANFLENGANFKGDIGNISFKNSAAFVAKLHFTYLDNNGKEQRTGAIGGDILVGQTRSVDPGNAGNNSIPNGFVFSVYSEVVGGTNKQAPEYFRYIKGNTKTASYTHSGTTLSSTLKFNGVN
jgi:hypothetical protein